MSIGLLPPKKVDSPNPNLAEEKESGIVSLPPFLSVIVVAYSSRSS